MSAEVSEALALLVLLLVAALATVAVLTRDPACQAVVLAVLGFALALLFTVLQAPDVALSQLGVGSAVTPLLIMLTIRRIRRGAGRLAQEDAPTAEDPTGEGGAR